MGMAHPYAGVVQGNASTAHREEHLAQLESETRECCLVQDHASDGHCASEKGDESVQVEEPSALERVCWDGGVHGGGCDGDEGGLRNCDVRLHTAGECVRWMVLLRDKSVNGP